MIETDQDISNAIDVLNKERFENIVEERVSLKICCNLKCKNEVSQEIFDKITKRIYQIKKDGTVEKVTQHVIFCDKVKSRTESECEKQYLKTKHYIENISDGGPFSTSFAQVVRFLERYSCESKKNSVEIVDREKIKQTVEKFLIEKAKIISPVQEKNLQSEQSQTQEKVSKEESKANQNFKIKVVSNRQNPASTVQIQTHSENQVLKDQEQEQKVSKKKKSVRFNQEVDEDHQDEANNDNEGEDSEHESNPNDASSADENPFQFEDLSEALEDYRQNEMSSFQKINDLFLCMSNDNLFYYLNGVKSYDHSDVFLKTQTRDFLLRQLSIYFDQVFEQCQTKPRKFMREVIDQELFRILNLIIIETLAQSFEKEEWKSISKVFLKLIEKRLPFNKEEEEINKQTVEYLEKEIILDEMEQIVCERVISRKPPLADQEIPKSAGSTKRARQKVQMEKFMKNMSEDTKQIITTINAIEDDLKLRMKLYGPESSSTLECLNHFVKSCNDHALFLIKKGEFRIATEILHQCEYVLSSPVGQGQNALKYQTFNNLAHSHNVQTNVRLSLKYLLRAVEYAHSVPNVNRATILRNQPPICLVESYLNVSNAYSFLSQFDQGLEYAERAIQLTQQLINDIIFLLDNQGLNPEEKEFYGEQYHSQINLHAMSFHTKGQIFEKLKQFEEAIQEYLSGKQVVEANYGTNHKLYMDFVNAINGAKLRIKYFMHSNLPDEGSEEVKKNVQEKKAKTTESLNQSTNESNLFILEQQRMKPMSQQKGKRIRPSSAKNYRPMSKGISMAEIKNRSVKRPKITIRKGSYTKETPPLSNRSTSSSNIDSKFASSQKRKLDENLRKYSMDQHSSTGRHVHTNQCNDCHHQLEEIRKLQIEQQKLMTMIMQQSFNNQNTSSQQQLHPPFNQQLMQSSVNSSQQSQMGQQMPPYQPYYMPFPPPMYMYPPQPYGMPYPGYPGFQSGIFLPQQKAPAPTMGPLLNNFMNSQGSQFSNYSAEKFLQSSQDPNGDQAVPNQPQFDWAHMKQPMIPSFPQFQYQNQEHQRNNLGLQQLHPRPNDQHHSASDLNERDSRFGEEFEHELKTTNKTKDGFKLHQASSEKVSQRQKEIDIKEKREALEKMKRAAIKIQTFYRRMAAQKNFQDLLNKRREKQQFHRQIYAYRGKDGKQKKMILIASLISILKSMADKKMKFFPNNVNFSIYDFATKKIIFESSHQIKVFGFQNAQNTTKNEIMNTVRNILSRIKFTGDPQVDLLSQLEANIKKQGGQKLETKILFAEPSYFSEGLKQIKDIKVDIKKEVSIKKDSPIQDDYEDNIDESIQEYSFKSEPVSDHESDRKEKSKSRSSSSSSDKSKKQVFVEEKVEIQKVLDHHEETSISKVLTLKTEKNNQVQSNFDYQAQSYQNKEKVRDSGYEFSKQEYKTFQSLHKQKTEMLIKQKTQVQPKQEDKSDSHYSSIHEEEQEIAEDLSEQSRSHKKEKKGLDKKSAAILIQARARGFLARKEAEKKKKTKLCQYVLRTQDNCSALVILTEKYSKKRKLSKFKLVVKNQTYQNRKFKANSHTLKLEKLPIDSHFIQGYLDQCLEITWKNQLIEKINLNASKLDIKALMKQHQLKVVQNPDRKQPIEINTATNEENLKSQLPSALNNAETVKKFFQSKSNKTKLEELRKIIKAQAMIRGYLIRKQYSRLLKRQSIKMLMRMTRRFSNGKLYYISLMVKNNEEIKSSSDPFYIVTVRQVDQLSELYDFEISLDNAKQIFQRKGCSNAQLQQLIMFETNRDEFLLMLECIDFIKKEFGLDMDKFRRLQNQKQNKTIGIKDSAPPSAQNQFKSQQTSSVRQPVQEVNFPSQNSNESFEEDIIEEAESLYEQSPYQVSNQKSRDLSSSKKVIKPQKIKDNKKKNQRVQRIIKIQSWVRGFLARKGLQLNSFKNRGKDPKNHLKLFKRGVFKQSGLFFMYFVYVDSHLQHVEFTLREVTHKVTVVNMKVTKLEEFADQEPEIDEIPDYFIDQITENGDEILINPKNGKLRSDWVKQLSDFVEGL